jgi:nucleoside-diphosphate-sugar epimerase
MQSPLSDAFAEHRLQQSKPRGNTMKVLVTGASGCVGQAVVRALRSRGHQVVAAGRGLTDGRHTMHLDYSHAMTPAQWSERLRGRRIDAVVNCAGILMPSKGQSFERVHTQGPIELFRGAAAVGITRVVQISALGVGADADSVATPYLHSKLLADEALATMGMDWAVLRPSLIYGPGSQSAALFATLASMPLVALPRLGNQPVQPVHVYEVAEAVARLLEQQGGLADVYELGGASALSYREMLQHYRDAMGYGPALWLPMPMAWMRFLAWASEALPQKVFCRDTLHLLEKGQVPVPNSAIALLGRSPSSLGQGLTVTPPQPLLDLQVQISPLLALCLRSSLAFMWIYTALISLWWHEESGVRHVLAACGLSDHWGTAALLFSCCLNTLLGLWTLNRPGPVVYALQFGVLLGYTTVAAYLLPELTLAHCLSLVKNLPVLGLIMLLWLSRPVQNSTVPAHAPASPLPKPGSAWS